ncbi:MAG: hypothetical protein ABIO86_09880, partial [Sphingomonas sp.]
GQRRRSAQRERRGERAQANILVENTHAIVPLECAGSYRYARIYDGRRTKWSDHMQAMPDQMRALMAAHPVMCCSRATALIDRRPP